MNYENAIIVHLINVKIVRQNIEKTLINLIHFAVPNVLKYVIVNNENY
jgi:3-dehydroquinate dehydratase